MSVPVYFNSPLSLLQCCCYPTEQMFLLDKACFEQNPTKRVAYIASFLAVQHTNVEKFPSKPFNPLLGETYEFIQPGQYKFLAEQVSHHPPITAHITMGKNGYVREGCFRAKNKFSRGCL